jgi:rhamnose utilization protein RhaD (predicted bifunctional aldolase and dehydrogenase)/NAD(P)-dependent dehydrogenase (short-subunit alcohol dehydrogenase family)
MRNLWDDQAAAEVGPGLPIRAYSSRLIGCDPDLVLHGGGNTSWKCTQADRFGNPQRVIWVKASGFDLGLMGPEGFTALMLDGLLQLAELPVLSDVDMVAEVKRARLNPDAAPASIEAIVHALFPATFVDHSHADAVLTLSNSGGRALLEQVYGDRVLILPYVKPGFDLARQIRAVLPVLGEVHGIILEHHGVFTWGETARESYDRMIALCALAEDWLASELPPLPDPPPAIPDPVAIAELRGAVAHVAGRAVLSLPAGQILPDEVATLLARARNGTLTPEHVIHNKPFPAVTGPDPRPGLADFATEYGAYVARAGDPTLVPLPAYPHWAITLSGVVRSFGPTLARARVSADVAAANLRALRRAGQIGHWQGLSEADLCALEYWELEQAKLRQQRTPPALSGKIAVVSGAAAGIGRACAEALRDCGAVVVGLDIDPDLGTHMNRPGYEGIHSDMTDQDAVAKALDRVVGNYGGLDIVVSNVGIFRTGAPIENLTDEVWDQTLAVNLTSHRKLLKCAVPFLRHGVNPAVVFIGSRNVAAPGAGAAAYSVSKAGLAQLMRVAALELAPEGITVNAVHPDAVFDTRLWTEEALEASARRYGISVSEYRSRNLLRVEVRSRDVARVVVALVDGTFSRTTGAQLPVDGGNDRVI